MLAETTRRNGGEDDCRQARGGARRRDMWRTDMVTGILCLFAGRFQPGVRAAQRARPFGLLQDMRQFLARLLRLTLSRP